MYVVFTNNILKESILKFNASTDENVEQKKHSHSTRESADWYNHFGKLSVKLLAHS